MERCENCCVALSQIVDAVDSKVGSQNHALESAVNQQQSSTSSLNENPAYRFWMNQSSSLSQGPMPETIGRYRIEKLIGSGGFGRVYKAIDDQLERSVAIKVPFVRTTPSGKPFSLIQKEAKIVASLDHHHIVPIYDLGTSEEFPVYLVTKLIDGENVSSKLQGLVALEPALRWTIQIAEALAYAHRKQVIHRDVKPQNILVDAQGQACLTDFGLAWSSPNDSSEYPSAGTPAYMSPEQLQPKSTIDHRTDIYSLGKVLTELLMRCEEEEARSPELVAVCQRATAHQASDRYESASELAAELHRFAHARGWSMLESTSSEHARGGLSVAGILRMASDWRRLTAVAVLASVIVLTIFYRRHLADRQRELEQVEAYFQSRPENINGLLKQLSALGSLGRDRLLLAAKSEDFDIRIRGRLALLPQQPELIEPLLSDMLAAPVELSSAISQELLPYQSQVKEKLIQVLQDESRSPLARLNASSFLAVACPDDPFWQNHENGAIVATAMMHDGLADMAAHAQTHRSVRKHITPFLRNTVLSKTDRNDSEISRALEVWEQLVVTDTIDADECVAFLIECPVEKVNGLAVKLKGNQKIVQRLRDVLYTGKSDPDNSITPFLYRAKFIAAYALYSLGSPGEFWHMWEQVEDPDLRSAAYWAAADSSITLSLLLDRLHDHKLLEPLVALPGSLHERLSSPTYTARRQMLLGLFRTARWQGLDRAKLEQLHKQIRVLVNQDVDSGTQAIAYLILKGITPVDQWESETWFAKDKLAANDTSKTWSLNGLGMQMIHIQNAEGFTHDFALGQREVERKFFEQFLNDSGYAYVNSRARETSNGERSHHFPQSEVSWYDCAAFCNWLSRIEGLQECYLPNAEGEYAQGMQLKPGYIELSGYRLPTKEEWLTCYSAGAKTRFSSGDSTAYTRTFAWLDFPNREATPTGHLPPNSLGFFDIQGNLSEWTLEAYEPPPTKSDTPNAATEKAIYIVRGGDYLTKPLQSTREHFAAYEAIARFRNVGFRVARSLIRD